MEGARTSREEADAASARLPEMEETSFSPICIQYAQKYIVTTSREGLLLIDQHRAHVKVLYERTLERVSHGGSVAQGVCFPGHAPATDIILRVLDSVMEDSVNYAGGKGSAGKDMRERMALVMARTSAIESGRRLSAEEMEHLVGDLFMLADPAFTPSGNRVYVVLNGQTLPGC